MPNLLRLVEETKEPKRDFVAEAGFDVVAHDKAIGDIGNLPKPLAVSAYFKRPFAVHEEIALSGEDDLMVFPELVAEERLAQRTRICVLNQGMHEIRVVALDFFRLGQVLERLALGREKREKPGAFKRGKHFESLRPLRS